MHTRLADRDQPAARTTRALVVAARAGDCGVLNELVSRHLSLVYALVRQTLGEHPEVDDVVQEVMLRAVQRMPELRDPGDFRPWLMAITMRQVSTHLEHEAVAARRRTDLRQAVGRPDPAAEFEGSMLLAVELQDQCRQLMDAARWLAAKDCALAQLWRLEISGELSRLEVAAAAGLSVQHVGVRLQRMRRQLDLGRAIVAVLEAVPRCRCLGVVLDRWDGVPSPCWRKRICRHLRGCCVCEQSTENLIAIDRLIAGLAFLPTPAAPAAGRIGHRCPSGRVEASN